MQARAARIDVALLDQRYPAFGVGLGAHRVIGGPEAADVVGDDPRWGGQCRAGQQQSSKQAEGQAHPEFRSGITAGMQQSSERFRPTAQIGVVPAAGRQSRHTRVSPGPAK